MILVQRLRAEFGDDSGLRDSGGRTNEAIPVPDSSRNLGGAESLASRIGASLPKKYMREGRPRAMSRQITLRLEDLDPLAEADSDVPETIVETLEGLHGVLAVGYDSESGRFAVTYDAREVSVLRILNSIEFPAERFARGYRPTDVQVNHESVPVKFDLDHSEKAAFSSSRVASR